MGLPYGAARLGIRTYRESASRMDYSLLTTILSHLLDLLGIAFATNYTMQRTTGRK